MLATTKDATFLTVHDFNMAMGLMDVGFVLMDFTKDHYVFQDNKYLRNAIKKYPNYRRRVTMGCNL